MTQLPATKRTFPCGCEFTNWVMTKPCVELQYQYEQAQGVPAYGTREMYEKNIDSHIRDVTYRRGKRPQEWPQ